MSSDSVNLVRRKFTYFLGGFTPQRTLSKYGNLEQAAATNAMQPRLDSGASRYSSDPTNGNLIGE